MGGVVKAIVGVVGIAAMFIPGIGTAIGAGLTSIGFSASVGAAILGGITVAGIGLGVSTVMKIAGLGPKSPKASAATSDRLTATINPRAYRSSVVGVTAFNTDIAYQEFTGANQEFFSQIIVCASHPVQSIDEIWIDDERAWTTSGGFEAKFVGYLGVQAYAEGTTANAMTITGSTSWTSANSRLVGCAYVWMRYKLTGNDKKAESPFSSGLSSRITIIGKGAKLYDPRLDSTVGGSGSHRANDQSTWGWVSDNVGRNPALQLLWFLLGYRIQNPVTSSYKLAVNAGLPSARIDLGSFITAANLCDEAVTLAAGGTEPRYRADGVWNEGDDPKTVQDALLAAMNGVLRDAGGRLRLDILHNDLASPVVSLTHADVVGEFQWIQTPSIDQIFNVVRGQYVDASPESLYQMVDYPDVRIASPDGIERDDQFICPMVQSASQAQRLAKAYLQRAQYPGTFSAEFLASAWRCEVGNAIEFTFPALGFSEKLFRVVEHSIQINGLCRMVLREENAAIYAWDAEESAAVVAADPNVYNSLNNPLIQAYDEALTLAAARGRLWTTPNIPSVAETNPGDTWISGDGTFYERVPGGILLGGFIVTLGGFQPSLYWTKSTIQPVVAAAQTSTWAGISGGGKPEDNADVTSSITGVSSVTIEADFTGVVTSALPRTASFKLIRNGVDVTTSTAWSVAVLSGVISASIGAANGVLSINTSGGVLLDSVLRITGVNGDRTRTFDVAVVKNIAAAPSTGGTGGTSAFSSFGGSTTIATMVAISPELSITIGTGGNASLVASYDFDVASNGSFDVFARWYRWNGSAYVAIGSEVQSSVPASYIAADLSGETGSGSCNFTDTGLTASSVEKYRLFMRNSSGTVARTISGNVAAVGS